MKAVLGRLDIVPLHTRPGAERRRTKVNVVSTVNGGWVVINHSVLTESEGSTKHPKLKEEFAHNQSMRERKLSSSAILPPFHGYSDSPLLPTCSPL